MDTSWLKEQFFQRGEVFFSDLVHFIYFWNESSQLKILYTCTQTEQIANTQIDDIDNA